MTPPPIVRQPEPPIPARKRKTIRAERLGARAQPICQTQKNVLAPVRTILLPLWMISMC